MDGLTPNRENPWKFQTTGSVQQAEEKRKKFSKKQKIFTEKSSVKAKNTLYFKIGKRRNNLFDPN